MAGSGPMWEARGNAVFRRPVTVERRHGSKSVSLGFKLCDMPEWVTGDDGEPGAEALARLLNAGEMALELLAALRAAPCFGCGVRHGEPPAREGCVTCRAARAVITKASPSPRCPNAVATGARAEAEGAGR